MKWLRSRCRGKREVPKSYLMYPEQMNEELQIRRVFNVIDADGSDALDLEEMVEMFNRYNISLDRDKLQKIYDIVDETRDGALNYREFKACALSPNANEIFSQIMNELHAKE
jgi:Ca2+-binding EF-hand superfamily protein